jgi:hypothetical protein
MPLGCQVVDATLKGIHEVVLGPGDAQLYVAAEQDEDLPYTASLTTYARDPATGALIAGGGERPGRTALAGG